MSDHPNNGSLAMPLKGQPFKKKQLDPQLFSGAKGTADDVRIQTGYPVWTLIAQWQAAGHRDDLLLAGYPDIPIEEWEAAKRYYVTHKPFIDARILLNSQPAADDDVPPMQTADEYFVYPLWRAPAPDTAR
ncbi:MAG: hypothetical protein ACRDHP_14100 [Ktedonobacterales bacterium]